MKDEIKELEFDHFKDLEELKHDVYYWIEHGELNWERWLGLEDIKTLLDYITNLQEKCDYLEDIVSNTELSNEIKKADKISKRDLYKWNYQRLRANQRLSRENERLKEISHKMHLWIFLHSGDEQKVYDELGLTDEENVMLGYSGQFIIGGDDNE